jgi:tripeptide aminopeptidase
MTETIATRVLDRTIDLAGIPAPTGREEARAALVGAWWKSDGLEEVRRDEAGNVWACARGGSGPALVLCAHLDTVFGADVSHEVRSDDSTLRGPSVGDDSIGVASLQCAASLLRPAGMPVWLLASVGEEGLGNLRGVTAALDAPAAPVGAFIAVEGNYLGRVSTVGLGSARRRIRVSGPGGHAWEAAKAPSAVHGVAELVTELAAMPRATATSVNVGSIGGGEGINVRAREAWFDLELRAVDPADLVSLLRGVGELLDGLPEPLTVRQESLGDRPAGQVDPGHPLVRAAGDALCDAGIDVTSPATSTDANAAHARGLPAIAVGITTGSGEHAPQEWIDTEPIDVGVRTLARTVERFEELSA